MVLQLLRIIKYIIMKTNIEYYYFLLAMFGLTLCYYIAVAVITIVPRNITVVFQ